jgi:hypothetical protein
VRSEEQQRFVFLKKWLSLLRFPFLNMGLPCFSGGRLHISSLCEARICGSGVFGGESKHDKQRTWFAHHVRGERKDR